ncbi:hypothetical protein Tco_1452660 [Tanacetum coccineum]
MLKFPVEGGVVTIRSNTTIPTECRLVAEAPHTPPAKEPTVTRNQSSNPPRVSGADSHDRRKSIKKRKNGTLQFAQRQLRHIFLETRRYNKRPKAPDRNKAIQEEVAKLVEVEIIWEVHYYDWLSNLVMVKKHDGSWRMCMDFTDLNKSCPKDCYPLPEIDWKVKSICGYPFKYFLDAYKWSVPRPHGQHARNQSLLRKTRSDDETTITADIERGAKPKWKTGKLKQILIQIHRKVTLFLQNPQKVCKKERLPVDTESRKGIPKHEEMHSGTTNGNRAETQRRATNVSLYGQGSSKHSTVGEKKLAENTNLFRQPRLASLKNKLQLDGKTGLSTSTCHKKAKEVLPGTPGSGDHGPTHQTNHVMTGKHQENVEMEIWARSI